MNSPHLRLFFFLIIGVMPTFTQWAVLTYDMTPRGLIVLGSMMLTQLAITFTAFMDKSSQQMSKLINDAEQSLKLSSTNAAGTTEATLEATSPLPA